MTTYLTNAMQITSAVMIVVFCAYASGRLHQWYRHGMDRDAAFRDGYTHASKTLFPLATRSMGATLNREP